MPDFLLPDLGEGLEEAEVIAWRVQVGDRVAVDQVVADVETAKAAVEVPVPFAGRVAVLHAEPGETIAVGAPLITIAVDDPQLNGLQEPAVMVPAEEESARHPGGSKPASGAGQTSNAAEGSGNVLIGYGTSLPSPATTPVHPVRSGPVPVISPLVRKRARDAGLDLTSIAGSGPGGLVRRHDVDQALAARREPAAPAPAGRSAPGETRIPLRGPRKAAADKLTRSRREIPEATVWVDADATELLAARAELNARRPGEKVSLLALLARFALAGLRRYPELNAHLDGDEVVIPAHVHLGFAVQTERGLLVPVIKDAHQLSTRELSAALAQQTAAARSGRLTVADLTGGTITVNNYGIFGVDGSAAIINHPEVAILGLGRIIDRPWVVDGQVTVRKVTELTLAFDHRACDGGTAGGYLRYVADCVERPALALADL